VSKSDHVAESSPAKSVSKETNLLVVSESEKVSVVSDRAPMIKSASGVGAFTPVVIPLNQFEEK